MFGELMKFIRLMHWGEKFENLNKFEEQDTGILSKWLWGIREVSNMDDIYIHFKSIHLEVVFHKYTKKRSNKK